MAKKKVNDCRYDFINHMREEREKLNRESPVLDVRWFVLEKSRVWTDEYDSDHGGKTRIVSIYFKTKEGAQKFIEEYEPDKGGTFSIASENLREYKEQRWGV